MMGGNQPTIRLDVALSLDERPELTTAGTRCSKEPIFC
jgi:hypothetical protein